MNSLVAQVSMLRERETCITPTVRCRSLWLHPLFVFPSIWGLIAGLYSMRLSRHLIFGDRQIIQVVLWIVVPFVLSVLVFPLFSALAPRVPTQVEKSTQLPIKVLERRLHQMFAAWCVATLVEIVVSGGLPIIWLINGSTKTYFDFGIPSVHGFLNSLLLAIGVCEVGLFALDGRKSHIWIPGWIVLWSVIAVTRNMLTVSLIQSGFVWAILRGINWRTVVRSVGLVLVLILVFGYIGDFRSGAEAFRLLAQPSDNYPQWLPSGVLWVYIYMTTPIGNLVNTTVAGLPLHSLLFPNTTSSLFPSVVRQLIYGADIGNAASGELVSSAFNVSTAYVGPYQDFGFLGIAIFSVVSGAIAAHCWREKSFHYALNYAVIGQCLVLSIFFNHLFYLPIITQIPWLYLFFWMSRARKGSVPQESHGLF